MANLEMELQNIKYPDPESRHHIMSIYLPVGDVNFPVVREENVSVDAGNKVIRSEM